MGLLGARAPSYSTSWLPSRGVCSAQSQLQTKVLRVGLPPPCYFWVVPQCQVLNVYHVDSEAEV
jgi:hypothetical protein